MARLLVIGKIYSSSVSLLFYVMYVYRDMVYSTYKLLLDFTGMVTSLQLM